MDMEAAGSAAGDGVHGGCRPRALDRSSPLVNKQVLELRRLRHPGGGLRGGTITLRLHRLPTTGLRHGLSHPAQRMS